MVIDWLTAGGTLAVAAITALLNSQGRTITAAELGIKADECLSQNIKNLAEDEKAESDRYTDAG